MNDWAQQSVLYRGSIIPPDNHVSSSLLPDQFAIESKYLCLLPIAYCNSDKKYLLYKELYVQNARM